MTSRDTQHFTTQLRLAKAAYDRTHDRAAYFGVVVKIALQILATELRIPNASVVLGFATPAFSGAIDAVSDYLACPVDNEHSAEDFLLHLKERVQHRALETYVEPIKNALRHLGLM